MDITKQISSEKTRINYYIESKASELFEICDKLESKDGKVIIPIDEMNKIHAFLGRLKTSSSWEYIDSKIEQSESKINLLQDVLKTLTQK